MLIPMNGQIQCGCCGWLQHFDRNTGKVELAHADNCCDFHLSNEDHKQLIKNLNKENTNETK